MSKIIVIVGPTGVGKTAASIHLAHKYNAEIINADLDLGWDAYEDYDDGAVEIIKGRVVEKESEGGVFMGRDLYGKW